MNTKLFVLLNTTVLIFSFVLFVPANSYGFDFASGEVKPGKSTRPRIYKQIKTEPQALEASAGKAVIAFELERQVFDLINQQRASNGLTALTWSVDAAKIARVHSENMANFKFFSHEGLDGLTVNERADDFGISNWRSIGENLAYNQGYDNPGTFAVERWMKSPGHRGNILNNRWKESAVGVAVSADKKYYFTEVFLVRY